MKTFEIFSEETEVEPKSCEHSTKPCIVPGCDNWSCEEYCAIDAGCSKPTMDIKTKKCCECGFCKNDSEETTGKFTQFSIPFSDFCNSSKKIFSL